MKPKTDFRILSMLINFQNKIVRKNYTNIILGF